MEFEYYENIEYMFSEKNIFLQITIEHIGELMWYILIMASSRPLRKYLGIFTYFLIEMYNFVFSETSYL